MANIKGKQISEYELQHDKKVEENKRMLVILRQINNNQEKVYLICH